MIGLLLAGLVGVVVLTDDARRQRADVIRTAIARARMTMKEAAAEAGRDQAQFTRQIDALEGSLATLYSQPDTFWQWFGVTIAERFGLPDAVTVGARLQRASVGKKRQAQMQLSADSEMRTA